MEGAIKPKPNAQWQENLAKQEEAEKQAKAAEARRINQRIAVTSVKEKTAQEQAEETKAANAAAAQAASEAARLATLEKAKAAQAAAAAEAAAAEAAAAEAAKDEAARAASPPGEAGDNTSFNGKSSDSFTSSKGEGSSFSRKSKSQGNLRRSATSSLRTSTRMRASRLLRSPSRMSFTDENIRASARTEVSPQPQQTRTRRISDQITTSIKFASGTETTDKKMSAADRGRAVAAEKVRKQNELLAAVVDPEEAAKAAAERAHGVYLPADEYVALVEEMDELRKKVEELELKSAKDTATIEELQGSGAFGWLGKRSSFSA